MPVAELPHSGEITAFRRQLMSVIGGCSDLLDDESDTRSCSDIGAPGSRSTAMTRQLAPPSERREQPGDSAVDGEVLNTSPDEFRPLLPGSLRDLGIRSTDIETIILKFLLNNGPHTGFEIAKQIRLPLTLIDVLLRQLKEAKLLFYKAGAGASDFLYELSEAGTERARRYWEHCTYFGSVPVP